MGNLQRKAIQTWLIGTPGLIVLLWLLGVPPHYETQAACVRRRGAEGVENPFSLCFAYLRQEDEESLFYIAERDWTPGVQLIAATTVVLVVFIAYLRIWKRPDES